MAHGHHLAVGRGRRDLEHVGHRRRGERVVAPGLEVSAAGRVKMPAPVVRRRSSPCRGRARAPAPTSPPKTSHDRLVAEADAERRHRSARAGATISTRRACVLRPAGAGEMTRCDGASALRLVRRRSRRCAARPPPRPSSPNRCAEVVGERVVVVDRAGSSRCASASVDRRLERGELVQALLVLGRRVGVGDDPAARLQVARRRRAGTIVRIAMHVSSAAARQRGSRPRRRTAPRR